MIEVGVERDLSAPPHDDQAEQAVLGSILKNPRVIHEVVDLLAPEAFYAAPNRCVFAAMLSLVRQDVAIDYHTVGAELERQGTSERAGGLTYLADINLATPSSAHIEHYGRIVADHHLRRRLISEAQAVAEQTWRARDPVDELLARSQAAMLGLSETTGVRARSTTAGEAIGRWLESFQHDSARMTVAIGSSAARPACAAWRGSRWACRRRGCISCPRTPASANRSWRTRLRCM